MNGKQKKQLRVKKTNNGLSLVEVLIVLAISGLTLVALLNLAVRDLQVENLNEEQDVANTASVSQLQQFEHIKNLSPTCAATMPAQYPAIKTYYICSPNNSVYNANLPSSAIANACENSSAYWITDGNNSGGNLGTNYTFVNPNNNFDCSLTNPTGTSVAYKAQLQVTNVSTNPNLMTINSSISYTGLNTQNYSISLQQEYTF